MAFSGFGQPTTFGSGSAFGAQPQQTTGPAPSAFSFGQPQQQQQQQQPAQSFGVGTSAFGATTTPAFGSGFGLGTPAASTAPTFSSFGQPQQQQQQTSSFFGSTPASTASQFPFGQTNTGTSSLGFGQPAAPTTSNTGFSGFGGFGSTPQVTQQQQPSTFGTTTGTSFGSGFGQSGSLFGGTQTTPAFGSTFNTAGLGTSQPSTGFGGLQSTGFGAKPAATAFSFSQPSFGQGSIFGQSQQNQQPFQLQLQQQQQQQQPQIDEVQAFQQSIFQCHKFGDERDSTLASLNYLQACWGAGKGFYSQTFPPVNFNQQNPFFRFKAVGYAFMYTDSNEDGQVVVNFKKPQAKLQSEETNIVSCLQTMLAKPNIIIRFTGTKAVSEDATMAIIFAEDRNTLRRVPATDMAAALHQPHLKAQLENLGVTSVSAKVKPSPEQLKRYLDTAPDGIDPRVWAQAQEDNPDPASMIPTSLVGVEALKSRIEWQEKETQQHHARIKLIGEEVTTLINRHANMTAELTQMKRKHVLLTHRMISVICRQELMRKQGTTLQPDEELLKKKLEEMDAELNSPTQYKGRLNELLSQIRLHKSATESRSMTKYTVEPAALAPVKDFLSIQQESVKHLVATTKNDLETLKEIMDGLSKLTTKVLN